MLNRKSVGDIPSSMTAFSYAQAAKGRPSSAQSSTPAAGADSSAKESTWASASASTSTTTPDPASVTDPKPDAELRRRSHQDLSAEGAAERGAATAVPQSKPASSVEQPSRRQPSPSPSSTPDPATHSPAAQAKEDDRSSSRARSTEPSWDKFSHTSNKTDRAAGESGGVEAEKDEPKEKSTAFVAAPMPTINVWQQRREAAQAAKAKAMGPPPTLSPVTSRGSGSEMPPPPAMEPGSGPPVKRTTSEKYMDPSKADQRKKGKMGAPDADGAEHDLSRTQHAGSSKERTRDSTSGKPKDEPVFKKPLPRPRNTPEKDRDREGPLVMGPPPVADSLSWPTPDTAQGEEKRKAQEKVDKGDKERPQASGSKPHGKEKWTPVPYTPNVIFETQLSPRRPMRPSRGAREGGRGGGHVVNGSLGGDRAASGSGPPTTNAGAEDAGARGRGDANAAKVPPPSWRTPKRAVSAGPQAGREQRRPAPTNTPPAEKRKEPEASASKNPDWRSSAGARRPSNPVHGENTAKPRPESRQHPKGEGGYPPTPTTMGPDRAHGAASDAHGPPRMLGHDRRPDGANRHQDFSREAGAHGAPRERGEPRSDRGRGGYRGARGGGNGYAHPQQPPPSTFSNGIQPGNANATPFTMGKAPSYTPYHLQQPGRQANNGHYGNGPPHARTNRRESHSPSRPTSTAFARYTGMSAPHQPMSPIQTQVGPMYEYQAIQAMSAVPYTPFVEQYSVLSMVSMQLEYYFSVDNLCKDMFLRKHMDSQGFVFLNVIANFNRIRQLTQDMELLRYACYQSRTIEFFQGPDGLDRVRRREGWPQWVLSMEERDPSAQTEGPGHPQRLPVDHAPEMDVQHLGSGRPSVTSMEMPRYYEHAANDPLYGPFNGGPPTFIPASHMPPTNGTTNGESKTAEPHLSALVPDFSPIAASPGDQDEAHPNDGHDEDVFSNKEVEGLVIVLRHQGVEGPAVPPHVSRTFSNGSIDARTIADAFSEHVPGVDSRRGGPGEGPGGHPSSQARTLSSNSPNSAATAPPPPVFWMKDCETPMESLPHGVMQESYNTFRKNALSQRELSPNGPCHRDMDVLYQFWSHFLVRNFNSLMYHEFRTLALEDYNQRHSDVGVKNLVQYYDVSLTGQKVISDTLAKHYVGLVESENDGAERLGLPKLRAAWRNGALNLKNRKKIDSFLTEDLKAKLEQ